VASLKRSTIDHSRPQAPAPALRVTRAHGPGEAQAEYGVEEIRSWRRNADEGGRIEYEVKWENDEVLTWEMFTGGGTEELQRALKAEEKRKPRKRRKRQAWVMEVEDGVDPTVFEADDWED
jgi:hypothetical protein